MIGVVSYSAYLPHYRLRRDAVAETLGGGPRAGTRTVAAYDEDTTSMGVEAARPAVSDALRANVGALYFATSAPAYADKTNATAIHAALRLSPTAEAFDLGTAVSAGVGCITTAVRAARPGSPAVAVLSDIRTGRPGSADEVSGGDGAAAFVFGHESPDVPVLAEVIASSHETVEILERWRAPGSSSSSVWEERFAEEAYVPAGVEAFAQALKAADGSAADVDHLIVAGLHARSVRRLARSLGTNPAATVDDRSSVIGNCGVAQVGLMLADTLDRAQPDQLVAVVVVSEGAKVLVLRTTDALPQARQRRTVDDQLNNGDTDLPYARFLSWRGFLDREPPRRPDPEPPCAPPAWRRSGWKFGFVASRCQACGTRHLPPSTLCDRCFADSMSAEPMADTTAHVATFTVDRLAATPSPPLLLAVLDFDGGGRFRCELTDASPEDAKIGAPVEMTFRRTVTANGIHNYFWKARPLRDGAQGKTQ